MFFVIFTQPFVVCRTEGGSISQSNDGRLLVYPGTTLHMECLFQKKFGTPVWSWQLADNSSQRSFLQVVICDPPCQHVGGAGLGAGPQQGRHAGVQTVGLPRQAGRHRPLHLQHAQQPDTRRQPGRQGGGHTPQHAGNTVYLSGQVSCPRLAVSGGVEASSNRTSLGARVTFSCGEPAHSLVGEPSLTCLPSGRWSHTPPTCLKVRTLTCNFTRTCIPVLFYYFTYKVISEPISVSVSDGR